MEDLEYLEVETISIPLEEGGELECAIMDEFEVDGQGYMVLAPFEGDLIGDDNYLYRFREEGDDLIIDYIEDEAELKEIWGIYEQLIAEEEAEAE